MAPTSIPPPWDAWALDKQFLAALDKWMKDHPDKKLDTVLESICTAMESGKDLMGFIPDSPFPARSLMQGLGGLVKLGNTVRTAKSAALKFAKKIVQWIGDVVKIFQDSNTGQFTERTWNKLGNFRDLVDEICQWANVRLGGHRWSPKTLNAESKIKEFESRLEEATNCFTRLSVINLSVSHNFLSDKIDKAHGEIETAREEIETILEEIRGLNAYVRQTRIEEQFLVDCTFIEKELRPFIAANSGHREQGKEFCSPGTRVAPLDEIKNWVSDLSTGAPHFFWLTGELGSGKSTIAATMCGNLKDSKNLWAELFIDRNYQTTTNIKYFFPSIALQLAKQSPEVARVIAHALQEKPSLVENVTETFAERLFREPLSFASKVTPNQAVVVVIDALDEVDAEKLFFLAKLLSKMTTSLAANIKVLITSREEEIIQVSWATASDTKHLSVAATCTSSIEDVESFLKQQIQEIADEHNLTGWPGEEKMQKLCLQASGLFIWATTATKYIRSQIENYGKECREDVLDQLNMAGMGDINKLYGAILDRRYPGQTDLWALETFHRIFGSIVALNTQFSVGTLAKILDLRSSAEHEPVDVPHFVAGFRTVLMAGTDEVTPETIPHLHKSFVEFVTGKNIRPDLQVSLLFSHKELAPKCLAHSVDVGDLYFHASRFSYQWTINELPNDHPDLPAYLGCFGDLERANYQHSGGVTSLDTSISVLTRAIQLTPKGHPDQPSYCSNLGKSLLHRFERFGDLDDLNQAISRREAAARLTPEAHPDQPSYCSDLGKSLLTRFERLGDLNDLNQAISRHEAAVRLTPEAHPDKPSRLANLGNSLLSRFEQLGDLDDLNQAISRREAAVRLTPEAHPDQPSYCSDLGKSLLSHFERLGDLNDLNQSVSRHEAAVKLTPEAHPDKPSRLANLGNSLLSRFEQLGDLDDLNQAISCHEAVIRLAPEAYPDKPSQLGNLGNSLLRRFEQLGDLDDLNQAISLYEAAVKLTPDGHPDKPSQLGNLGNSLLSRFKRLGDLDDINQSVLMLEAAVQLTPDRHPDKPSRLNNLGNSLHQRFERLHNPQDSQQLLLQYTLAACLLTGPAHIRFHAATIWANHARILQHNSVLRAYATAIGLLPELAWLGLSISDRLHSLLQAGQVVRDAASAAIAVHDYQKAVEWLEQGRSVIWGQLISLRTPVDHLLESYPELAAKLIFLSPSLERPESIAQQSHALALERDHLLQQIRELPGFERFLLPRSISELSLVAQVGLVAILNISKYGCDALILMPGLGDEVIHVPLHDFTLLEAQVLVKSLALGQREKSMASDKIFSHILSELWLKVVQPVLNALGITTPSHQDLPRIWWCPTGPLAFLPIHAAGIYGEHEAFGSKLSDFLISSYTPSLTALIQGFRPRSESQNRLQLLAVSQPSGQGRSHAGIEQEIRCIERHAMGKVHVLRLDQDTATIDRFRQSIRDATWVHFAGNVQNPSAPTDTALLLARNSRFTLSDILQLRLPHADLAFLSANHTAAGSKDLEDESVHLVAAMLSAGYRGVIGAMWDFRDDAAVQVADEVYAHLFKTSPPDSTSAAEALHIAVRRLREGPGANASFQRWVPFVHFGV